MSEDKLSRVEQAYNSAGFKTVRRVNGCISFSREAPVAPIGQKGGCKTVPPPIPKSNQSEK